jgi:hypothetical protein
MISYKDAGDWAQAHKESLENVKVAMEWAVEKNVFRHSWPLECSLP